MLFRKGCTKMQKQQTEGIQIGTVFMRGAKKAANREHRLFAKMTSTAAKDFDFVFPEDIARQIAIRIRMEQEAEEKTKQ